MKNVSSFYKKNPASTGHLHHLSIACLYCTARHAPPLAAGVDAAEAGDASRRASAPPKPRNEARRGRARRTEASRQALEGATEDDKAADVLSWGEASQRAYGVGCCGARCGGAASGHSG